MTKIAWFLAIFSIPIVLARITPLARTLLQNRESYVQPPSVAYTLISGHGWAYRVPFPVQNTADIQKLIKCESSGQNISRPDRDGIYSDGILQFHRASKISPLGSGTWAWMEKLSGIKGSPIIPADAIRMTDWAISHGLVGQWSCARLTHII